jgi:hypothetical protein
MTEPTTNLPAWLLEEEASITPGIKALILGDSGSGKTYLMASLIEAGLEVFHIGLEPARPTIAKAIKDKLKLNPKLDFSKYHYFDQPALEVSFASMNDTANKLNTLSFKAICDLEGLNRNQTRTFLKLLDQLGNYKEGDGSLGPVDKWDNTRVIVLDSLSALNIMAKSLIAGQNPALSPSQWNMAQDSVRMLLNKLCFDCNCHVFVLGHLEPEKDEVSGMIKNMPSTLGKKLGPELGRYFDEVIVMKKLEDGFFISTKESNTVTKNRYFPVSNKLPATLVPLINEWREVNHLKAPE